MPGSASLVWMGEIMLCWTGGAFESSYCTPATRQFSRQKLKKQIYLEALQFSPPSCSSCCNSQSKPHGHPWWAATWEKPARETRLGLHLSTSVSWAAARNQESPQRWNHWKIHHPVCFGTHGRQTALVWSVRAWLDINTSLSRVCNWENGSFHCASSCLSANAKSLWP